MRRFVGVNQYILDVQTDHILGHISAFCVCVCVCVRARLRACVCVSSMNTSFSTRNLSFSSFSRLSMSSFSRLSLSSSRASSCSRFFVSSTEGFCFMKKKGEGKSGRGEEKRKWGRGRKTETDTAGWVEGSVGGRKSGREGRRAR
jgi:hypothetical protein